MRKKRIITFILIIFIVINASILYVTNKIYEQISFIDIGWGDDHFQSSIAANFFDYKRYDKLKKEEVSILSKYGYKLYGTYILNEKPTKNTIIILHGIGSSRWTSMKYADMYLNNGYNVLVYDSKGYGQSGGEITTYGYYEKYDLDSWVNYISDKNQGGIIGVHGESMGGATALLHSEINERDKKVKFYVADSSYSDLATLVREIIYKEGRVKLAAPLIFYGDIVTLIRGRFIISNVSPIKAIANASTPIMFIHGEKDQFVPSYMSRQMYDVKKGIKDIYIAKNASHVQSLEKNEYEYAKRVYKFINEALND